MVNNALKYSSASEVMLQIIRDDDRIKTYRKRLMLKLNVNNTAQLVKMAMEENLV